MNDNVASVNPVIISLTVNCFIFRICFIIIFFFHPLCSVLQWQWSFRRYSSRFDLCDHIHLCFVFNNSSNYTNAGCNRKLWQRSILIFFFFLLAVWSSAKLVCVPPIAIGYSTRMKIYVYRNITRGRGGNEAPHYCILYGDRQRKRERKKENVSRPEAHMYSYIFSCVYAFHTYTRTENCC